MHVPNLNLSGSAAPGHRTAASPTPSEKSGFDAVYEGKDRQTSEAPPRNDVAGEKPSAAPGADRGRERAGHEEAPGRDSPEADVDTPPTGAAKETLPSEGGGTVFVTLAEPAAPSKAEPGEIAGAQQTLTPAAEQSLPAAAEGTERRGPSAATVTVETSNRAPQVGEKAEGRAVAALPAAGRDEAPARSIQHSTSIATETTQVQSPPQPAASPSQQALPSTARPAAARDAIAEEVVVRRVRGEGPAEAGLRSEARLEQTPRPAEPKGSGSAVAAAIPAGPAADQARPEAIDPQVAEVAPAEGRSPADQVARTEAAVRHETPRPVMQQVAEAARALREGPVELTLQPEELGKVRMTLLAGADGAMTMTLQAERPETLELLRRHIGELARELQGMGFDNLNFSFGKDRSPPDRQRESTGGDHAGERSVAAIPLAQQGFAGRTAPVASAGGLDLRL